MLPQHIEKAQHQKMMFAPNEAENVSLGWELNPGHQLQRQALYSYAIIVVQFPKLL